MSSTILAKVGCMPSLKLKRPLKSGENVKIKYITTYIKFLQRESVKHTISRGK
jgi:hypothetical protein